jgi:ribosomal protein S18 acetylase RimI-like enzyme
VYAGAENSVYIAARARGRGIGRALLDALIRGSEAAGFWTIQTGIFPENLISVRLHQACGFWVVGRRERIGTARNPGTSNSTPAALCHAGRSRRRWAFDAGTDRAPPEVAGAFGQGRASVAV